jgi:hypothetical protein
MDSDCRGENSWYMLQALQGRWTLDDVERISRGKSSKAKMGSRQVPHRLSAEERKAYDLAKKKGYLVVRVLSRRYPLVNTYRNFCDASNCPCIFIEQVLVSEILIFQLGL